MIELLRFILITIHVLAGAAWFGAMLYSLLALHPRALLFFKDSKQFEDFIAFLAAGARWKVLGIMVLIAFSGMALLFLPGAQQTVLFRNCVIIKIILFIFAWVVFCYASWMLWPARIMAGSHEIPMFQRKFRVVANVLICLVGSSMVLGLASAVEPVSSAVQTNAVNRTIPQSSAPEPMNAMTATNLEQWKEAIKRLGKLRGFTDPEHWLVEQRGRKTGLPIILSIGGQTVKYSAVLISVNAKAGSGQVVQVDLQSPNMNIDDTREMGLQLYRMMGLDPSQFIAWCNQVGNHWMDSTLFDSMAARIPNSNKFYGFGLLHSYSDERPWSIDFFITAR